MNAPPTPAADIRDQQIADPRAALQRAVPLLAFAAGREADTDPRQLALLSAAADDLTDILDRTTP
ncbi:hypothetical protein [Streptomyces bikiniensis]|uniref:hypothetical protein n=1 Tax=Streptomyces bikiniensis TaxID=1896 RepID=UPI0004BE9413|nr:hypothetical protein [Streptomyces bikiniensis]